MRASGAPLRPGRPLPTRDEIDKMPIRNADSIHRNIMNDHRHFPGVLSGRHFFEARPRLVARLLAALLGSVGIARAQYVIDWHAISAGGSSSDGDYSLSGGIGQPEAGVAMTGGSFSLTGGFWALPVMVQSVNAPTLSISPAAPGYATISWTPETPGFVLQFSPTLGPAGWNDLPGGSGSPVTVPLALSARFYRLHKP